MGKSLAEKSPAAARIFQMCDRLRPGTSQMCFEGSVMELQETKNTQPCLFAMELAAYEFLAEKGVQPDMAAGFSLGEVTAATAAGIFDYETGFQLVCLRGEFMQKEAEKFDTSMAAVLKLDEERVGALCSQFSHIYPVNYNCPGQITVSGLAEEMKSFLRSNTGLISRFNKFISFEDYTQAQLLEILKVMAGQAGMTVEENALKRIGLRLAAMNEQERQDFGNARGVRNLFEKMIVNQANRLVTLEEPTREQLMTLTEADV